MTSPREALRAAIEAHDAALAAAKSAEATLARAAAYHNELTNKLAEFADVDARVASERADAIRAAMANGTAPVFEVSAELSAALAKKLDAENRLEAAKQAVSALHAEHDAAQQHAERVGIALEWAAERVMLSAADALAAEYAATLSKARELYLAMWGMSVAPIRRPPEEITRLSPAPTRSLRVSPDVAAAVNAAEIIIETSNTRRDLYRKQMRAAVAGWLAELKSDPAAELSVPREASAQVKAEAA